MRDVRLPFLRKNHYAVDIDLFDCAFTLAEGELV
jgi:hypothetical protein